MGHGTPTIRMRNEEREREATTNAPNDWKNGAMVSGDEYENALAIN